MANFNQTSMSMSARREFTVPIADAAVFDAAVESLLTDTTMGLSKKEKMSEAYGIKIEYLDAAGEVKSSASAAGHSRADMAAITTLMTAAATAEAFAGADGQAVEQLSKRTWNVRVSCELAGDSFTVSLNRESMVVSGYARAETIAAVETWADSVSALA
jgi:hypothetical protein